MHTTEYAVHGIYAWLYAKRAVHRHLLLERESPSWHAHMHEKAPGHHVVRACVRTVIIVSILIQRIL